MGAAATPETSFVLRIRQTVDTAKHDSCIGQMNCICHKHLQYQLQFCKLSIAHDM